MAQALTTGLDNSGIALSGMDVPSSEAETLDGALRLLLESDATVPLVADHDAARPGPPGRYLSAGFVMECAATGAPTAGIDQRLPLLGGWLPPLGVFSGEW